jgi:hypothetical protein
VAANNINASSPRLTEKLRVWPIVYIIGISAFFMDLFTGPGFGGNYFICNIANSMHLIVCGDIGQTHRMPSCYSSLGL